MSQYEIWEQNGTGCTYAVRIEDDRVTSAIGDLDYDAVPIGCRSEDALTGDPDDWAWDDDTWLQLGDDIRAANATDPGAYSLYDPLDVQSPRDRLAKELKGRAWTIAVSELVGAVARVMSDLAATNSAFRAWLEADCPRIIARALIASADTDED